ncbi:MAG: Uma2 family endonuclease [Planctomycetota bacterium]
MSTTEPPDLPSRVGEPAWEVAHFFPVQGEWTERDYFAIESSRPVELANGRLELLPMPTWMHQLILEYLFDRLRKEVDESGVGGKVMIAPLPVRLFPGTVREPDVLYLHAENLPASGEEYPNKLDLAIEIVSHGKGARDRDYVAKRKDYEKARVKEYWIVDPIEKSLTLLELIDGRLDETPPSNDGFLQSRLIPTFTLHPSLFDEFQPPSN